jgi:predicted DNA-binding transcriptional regulator
MEVIHDLLPTRQNKIRKDETMRNLMISLLINYITSSLMLKRNLDWHRKLVWIFAPLFFIFTQIQTEYTIKRIKQSIMKN